jgi:hypothetical protein
LLTCWWGIPGYAGQSLERPSMGFASIKGLITAFDADKHLKTSLAIEI